MKVIKLVHGVGNGVDRACLMTASNMLIGRGIDGDSNDCVCGLLRSFIIVTNDRMPLDLLSKLYGPLVWEILGTRSDDPEILKKRKNLLIEKAVRELLPHGLRLLGQYGLAHKFATVTNIDQAKGLIHSYRNIVSSRVLDLFSYTELCLVEYADIGRQVGRLAGEVEAWELCPQIIREIAAIGDKRPVECVLNMDQLAEKLNA